MKLAKTLTIIGSATSLSLFTATYYNFPELRDNKYQLFKAMQRYNSVIATSIKMGCIYQFNNDISMSEKHDWASRVLLDALIQNQGFYIKMGQLLTTLDVLIPPEYMQRLELLCGFDCLSSKDEIENVIKENFGKSVQEIFSEFDYNPIKSASIAQVHKGRLRENGDLVAVKIQHQWLAQQIPGDIRLIQMAIEIGNYFFPQFRYKWFGEEIKTVMPKELDFNLEAANLLKCKNNFQNDETLYVPKMYPQYSNKNILTMEFIDGISIGQYHKLIQNNFDMIQIAKNLATAFQKQIFIYGFVHADPHQGNIFLRKIKDKNNKEIDQIVLLDHGIYKQLQPETIVSYAMLWKGILLQNEDLMKQASERLGAAEDFKLFVGMITSKPYEKIQDKQEQNMKKRMTKFQNQQELNELYDLTWKHHQQITKILETMDRDLLQLFKVNEFLYSLDKRLGSPINTYQITLNYCHEAMKSKIYWNTLSFSQKFRLQIENMWINLKILIFRICLQLNLYKLQ